MCTYVYIYIYMYIYIYIYIYTDTYIQNWIIAAKVDGKTLSPGSSRPSRLRRICWSVGTSRKGQTVRQVWHFRQALPDFQSAGLLSGFLKSKSYLPPSLQEADTLNHATSCSKTCRNLASLNWPVNWNGVSEQCSSPKNCNGASTNAYPSVI